jgi:hypothetical protein
MSRREIAGITAHGTLLQKSEERMDTGGGLRKFAEAAHAITDYIVGYYSALRPHEYNGGLPQTNRKIDTGKL